MKFLIAGLGSIGRRHFRNLLALGQQDIVMFRSFQSTLPDDELTGFPVETKIDAALAHKPDAVIISNPTALHLDVAIPAAKTGCHMLLEKPISHSLKGVEDLQEIVRNKGIRVLVGFQFRFHPGLRQAAQWLKDGLIGRPLSVRAVYGEFLPGMHPWEDYRRSYSARQELGGGVVLTLCHPLDYLRWLLGEVRSIWAFIERLNDLDTTVEDTAEIGLQFEAGIIGSVHLNYNQSPSSHHLEIVGTQGTLRWDSVDGVTTLYRADPASGSAEEGDRIKFSPRAGFERNDMFLEEMRHFISVVKGESQPVCTLEDGRRALELALGAYTSARYKKLVQIGEMG